VDLVVGAVVGVAVEGGGVADEVVVGEPLP
jgi:hypothetical protein